MFWNLRNIDISALKLYKIWTLGLLKSPFSFPFTSSVMSDSWSVNKATKPLRNTSFCMVEFEKDNNSYGWPLLWIQPVEWWNQLQLIKVEKNSWAQVQWRYSLKLILWFMDYIQVQFATIASWIYRHDGVLVSSCFVTLTLWWVWHCIPHKTCLTFKTQIH